MSTHKFPSLSKAELTRVVQIANPSLSVDGLTIDGIKRLANLHISPSVFAKALIEFYSERQDKRVAAAAKLTAKADETMDLLEKALLELNTTVAAKTATGGSSNSGGPAPDAPPEPVRRAPLPEKTDPVRYQYTVDLQLAEHATTGTKGKTPASAFIVTMDMLAEKLETPAFIEGYVDQLRQYYNHKLGAYTRLSAENSAKLAEMEAEKKKKAGSDSRFSDLYPQYESLRTFVAHLTRCITGLKGRIAETSTPTVKQSVHTRLHEALHDTTNGVASLKGREEVMNIIAGNIDSFSRSYRVMTGKFSHMVIMGPSGCGKTKIANTIAYVYAKAGFLLNDTPSVVTRADLVGSYIGHTAPRVRAALCNALESVLFIDEAYELYTPGSERDFGKEAITEMVFFVDRYIGMNLIIAAGYEAPMRERFLGANEGMNRRFPVQVVLAPYTNDALAEILITRIKELGLEVTTNIRTLLTECIGNINEQNAFTHQAADMVTLADEIFATSLRDSEPWSVKRAKLIVKDVMVRFLHRKGFTVVEMKVSQKKVTE